MVNWEVSCVEKKAISIIALDPRAARSYGRDVEGLFGEVADVSVFSVMDGSAMGVLGCAGAFLVSLAVVGLANLGGRANAVKLLLAGSALSAVCSGFSNLFIFILNDDHAASAVVQWSMGSLAGADWESNGVILPVVLVGTLFFWSQYRNLNLMLLGDESAVTLGTDLHRWRLVYLLVSALLVGFVVYKAGLIGFVGLVIPHLVRSVVGADHRRLIPLSALCGAVFMIWMDVGARLAVRPEEIPVGIITAFIGAPLFLWMIRVRRYEF